MYEELKSIVGVGDKIAENFINSGVTSINDLKLKIKSGEIKVNDKILLGIKYHKKIFDNIPRKEINNVKTVLDKIIEK